MKKIALLSVFLLLGCFLVAGNAMALNIRPVTIQNSGEESLQQIFNSITVSGPGINASNGQTNYSYFTNDSSGGAVATFILEIAGNAGSNTFGIYSSTDPNNKAEIFSGADTTGSQSLISFLSTGDIKVDGTTVASNFGSSFGFYLGTKNGDFYSDDQLNPGDNPQALIYQGDDKTTLQIDPYSAGLFTPDEFILAWEDIAYAASDKDFNDMVVEVESVAPVPEPATVLLLGVGLLGLGAVSRKKLMN